MAIDNTELTEQLFKAIDTIIVERLRNLPYDKTITATIIDNTEANYGRYKVTTDDNITFLAYAELTTYAINDKVYIRIPENDYTKQKVITGRYIPTTQETKIVEQKFSQLVSFQKSLNNLQEQINELREKGE